MQAEKRKTDRRRESTKNSNAWEPVKVFRHAETGIASRVFRVSSYPHPRYSYEIGFADTGDLFKRFQIPVVKIESGKVEVTPIDPDAVRWVMEEAEIYILEETQKREEELQLQSRSRTQRQRQQEIRRD
jgi:hypothetical protein